MYRELRHFYSNKAKVRVKLSFPSGRRQIDITKTFTEVKVLDITIQQETNSLFSLTATRYLHKSFVEFLLDSLSKVF